MLTCFLISFLETFLTNNLSWVLLFHAAIFMGCSSFENLQEFFEVVCTNFEKSNAWTYLEFVRTTLQHDHITISFSRLNFIVLSKNQKNWNFGLLFEFWQYATLLGMSYQVTILSTHPFSHFKSYTYANLTLLYFRRFFKRVAFPANFYKLENIYFTGCIF